MPNRSAWQLRAEFARRLSVLYAAEVPAYATLVETCQEINQDAVRSDPDTAQHLADINRVTAERHGAIRVGNVDELRQVARIFAAAGMTPVGFYDLRTAHPTPLPVVSTAFRPREAVELARNPFRVFVSMLTSDDRRFFDAELDERVRAFVTRRTLFPDELLQLADEATASSGLSSDAAERFLDLACASFALSPEPIDRAWYERLEGVSSVAADIAGVTSTHINHLTPRVLDIDELQRRMTARGVTMIDQIQGPPRWDGPDVLLRQTSFRALAEPRSMLDPDGQVRPGRLRVRFGEVESRGIALTPLGRERYDAASAELQGELTQASGADAGDRAALAAGVWARHFPVAERELMRQGLGYFTFAAHGQPDPSTTLEAALEHGSVTATPIGYEDFLPRSAAGIFNSNLTGNSPTDTGEEAAAHYDLAWLSDSLQQQVPTPEELAAAQQQASIDALPALAG